MKKFALIPVMFCFFAMGFVDLVGIASNYVKEDLQLTDSVPDFQRTYRDADEQDRPKEHCIAIAGRDYRIAAAASVWRELPDYAMRILAAWHR